MTFDITDGIAGDGTYCLVIDSQSTDSVKYLARDMLGHASNAHEDDMRRFAERWRPYRGLALIYVYAELAMREG